MRNVLARDIQASLEKATINAAQWLLRAGAKLDIRDLGGNHPLHHAANGGMAKLVQLLLDSGGR